ncbi:DUF3592 domain-containing protein [Candidatus Omnitrophota bacterium]
MAKEKKTPWWIIIVLISVGIIWFGADVKALIAGRESLSWETATGVINSSQIRETREWRGKGATQTKYVPCVNYSYFVDSEEYVSDTLSFQIVPSIRKEKAQKILEQYPTGAKATVYFNPSNHAEATLVPGAARVTYLNLLRGLFFIAIGAFVWRKRG